MTDGPPSAELSQRVSALARALLAAARSYTLYPSDHPAVRNAAARLRDALSDACGGRVLSLGVTPDTLLVLGPGASPLDPLLRGSRGPADPRSAPQVRFAHDEGTVVGSDGPIGEAADWLHRRDIVLVSFAPDIAPIALQGFLTMLAADPADLRERGGPARVWASAGLGGISLGQIDFSDVLEDREVGHPARRKDDIWRSIVEGVCQRRRRLEEAVQRRLLEIAGDVVAIGELAKDVIAPHFTAGGSPMLTSQSEAVMAAFRHMASIIDVLDPGRRVELMNNLATATATLDPRVVLQMLSAEDGGGGPAGTAEVREGLIAAFDEHRAAQLLAATLVMDGRASNRLARVFDTIVPDDPRKRRVLTLTRSMLNETAFSKSEEFKNVWATAEQMLLTYNDRPFVSAEYQAGLDSVGTRAAEMAGNELPPDLAPLLDTLAHDNVRKLSASLLVDLLRLERDRSRAPEVARDVAALAEDLLLEGDYDAALTAAGALAELAGNPKCVASGGARVALDQLADSAAFAETIDMLADMQEAEAARVCAICEAIGPPAVDQLRRLFDVQDLTAGAERARPVLRGFGSRGVGRLGPLVASDNWYARVHAAEILAEIGVPEAVPLLQSLLRGGDPRVMQAAVRALSNIDDPAAGRAVHTVLRAASGEQRRAVVDALVAERDVRVIPVLACILQESEPFGSDHQIVLETLAAVGRLGRDETVPHVSTLMRRRKWYAPWRTNALKTASLDALRAIGSPAACQAIRQAAASGDRRLRKLAAVAVASGSTRISGGTRG